jgi:hypothetical protein
MISGYSWTTFDDLTLFLLRQINPQRVLDVGAGEGKYGRLIREAGLHELHLTAIEYEPKRRDELLAIGYNEVHSMSVLDLLQRPADGYEVIILGDVIEHFRKSEGQDLLEFLNYRAAYLFVVTPEAMPMSTHNFYEGHNSLWRPEAMRWHDLWAHCRNGVMHFYLLRGLLKGNGVTLADLVQSANGQEFMRVKTSPNQTDHPRVLSVHDEYPRDIDLQDSNLTWSYRHP